MISRRFTHEGTSRVKEYKISILSFDYELFKAKPEKGIKEMSYRFTHIINSLKTLGKIYPNKEMVKNMLNSIPTSWEPKVMAIEESKDLNSLSLDELIGSLLTYDMKINYNVKEIKEVPKKVGVAFKSTTCEKDEDSSNNDDDDDEMEMFAKRFKRFMKFNKARRFQKNEGLKNESTKEKDPIICYDDEDSSKNKDKKIANLCLMNIDDIK
ncbi:hypothetical protein Golax_010203, partial [Gossypium laxum]|nr:hypothetical protein [Gossypium laxum]